MPRQGRYANEPAVPDETGAEGVPPKPIDALPALAIVCGMTVLGVAAFLLADRKQCRHGTLFGGAKSQLDLCDAG